MILLKIFKNKIRTHYWKVLWEVIKTLELPNPRCIVFWLLLGGVVFGILELMGILIVFPILKAIVDFQTLLIQHPDLYFLLKKMPLSPQGSLIFFLCCVMMLIIIIKNLYMFCFSWVQEYFLCSWKIIISQKLMSYYLLLSFEDLLARGVNEPSLMIANYVTEVFNKFVLSALNLLSSLLIVLVIVLFFIWLHPILIIFTLTWFSLAIFFMYRLLTYKIQKLSDANAEAIKNRFYNMQYMFQHAREIRIFQKKDFFYNCFYNQTVHFMHADSRLLLLKQVPMLVLEVVLVLGMLIVVLATMYHHLHDISYVLSIMAVLTLIFMRMGPIFNKIQVSAHELDSVSHITEKVLNELYLARLLLQEQCIHSIEKASLFFTKSIVYHNVTFCYKVRPDISVLKNINVSLNKGKKYGIVGYSGAGKTTFIDIFLGLLFPTKGSVLIDGKPLSQKNVSAWQKHLSFVPQNVDVSEGTFKENVAFGENPELIVEERVWKALEKAQLIDFVKKMPNGINSPVGYMSGGQKQRIGLARAFYYKKEIVVLDEPTAALDVLTEAEIMKTIMDLQEKTILIIAHRLSTLKVCDILLYFQDGILCGEGSFKSLSARFPEFNKMVQLSSF